MILADEPTGNLDTKTGADVIALLESLAAGRGATVIVATHDAGLAARAPRRLAMRDGAFLAAAPALRLILRRFLAAFYAARSSHLDNGSRKQPKGPLR